MWRYSYLLLTPQLLTPYYLQNFLFVVAVEDAAYNLSRQFLADETYDQYNGEAANHGDGTAVDGVDGITQKHVDNRQSYTQMKHAQTEVVVTPRQ